MNASVATSSTPFVTLDSSYYTHRLDISSAKIKTNETALKIFNIIRLLLIPVIFISIAHAINPLALICSLVALVILGVVSCRHSNHKSDLKIALNTFEAYVDEFLALNNYQQMDLKIPILKNYPHMYRCLDLSRFEPGVRWVKAEQYCKKLYPEIAERRIQKLFGAVIPAPSLISLKDIDTLDLDRKYNHEQEIRTLIEKVKMSRRINLTFSDVEQIAAALKPMSTDLGAFQLNGQLQLLSKKIEAMVGN